MDIVIDELIIEEDRPEHIAKHNVSVDEILEVVFGDYATGEGKEDGLVTARDAKKKEKLLYQEKFEKGIKNES